MPDALAQRQGRKLVFTNGVFDVLHAGHVRYLEAARALGDLLIVGLNSDESVRRLGKGPNRPIHSLAERAEVLAALRSVDGVVAFDEDLPIRLIEILRPEIHAKGGDYNAEDLPETPAVRSYGGSVAILPLSPGLSSSRAIRESGWE